MDVPLTLVLMACVFTTYIKGSNSLQLTSSPATASPHQPYTLMCSSSGNDGRTRAWYWRNDLLLRTRYVSDTNCQVEKSNDYNYRHLSGRINVSCSHNQHNVTLRILTSIDNGSVWWCVDTARSQESNRLTIHVVNLTTASSTATKAAITATTGTSATTTTTATTGTSATTAKFDISSSTSLQEGVSTADHGADEKPTSGDDAPNVVYIAVGAAVGGVVVGCVISAIVFIMWMRRRNTSTEDDASAPNIYTSPAHYEDMEHQYDKVDRQYVNTVKVSGAGSPDSVNTGDQAGNAAYYNTTGQHQHPDEHANAGNTTYYNDSRDANN
ncbi:uncharacterized protein LOC125381522 [Haliotis rufescens]|uniref:uncharacterized protein LOC125381522 n=1 Tax=Haliotis rufescens TaxID=6454 RepID=UPI00201EF69F|nr:uncharacterized protein LOC125381522 [Haliotis rufescens]